MMRRSAHPGFVVLAFAAASLAAAQPGERVPLHSLAGSVSFWHLGDAGVASGRQIVGSIDAAGSFALELTEPEPDELAPVARYDGVFCLSSTDRDSRYTTRWDFELRRGEEPVALLRLQTPFYSGRIGEAFAEFHYYSEDTVVSGRCVHDDGTGFRTITEFPLLAMKRGWNILTNVVTQQSDDTIVYSLRLDHEADLRWELEPPPLDGSGEYGGIGAVFGYGSDAIAITGIRPGGPAERAGLRPGDIVTHIGDEATAGMNLGAAILRIRGTPGEMISLRVARGSETLAYEVVRERLRSTP